MRYLTRKRWAGARSDAGGETGRSWGKALRAYREQLETLRPRFPDEVFAFFDRADIHEGELLHLDIGDGGEPVRVALAIRDVYDRQSWTLEYGAARRAVVDVPAQAPPLPHDGEGFGELACHELTDCGGGYFRHEILFASGATLLFEFREIAVQRSERGGGQPPDVQAAPA
jgi:hypothetical protein